LFSNQKSQLGEKCSGYQIGKCWYILWTFRIFFGHLGYWMTIWHIVCSVGAFFPVLVSCTKKNLATLEPANYQKWRFFCWAKKKLFFLKVKQRRERIELGRRKEESSGKKKRRATSYDAILVPSRYIDPRSVSHLHTQVGIVMPGYKILHPGLKLLCVLGKNCHAQV
jgi:hypothetical protein